LSRIRRVDAIGPDTRSFERMWVEAAQIVGIRPDRSYRSEAGRQLFSLTHDANSLSPAAGALLFVGYCALTLAIAAVLLVRRDT
jgi:hypothetical protein